MQTTGKKVITRVLGLTYAPCMGTYTNSGWLFVSLSFERTAAEKAHVAGIQHSSTLVSFNIYLDSKYAAPKIKS